MSYATLVSKLAALKYPYLSNLTSTTTATSATTAPTISFDEFTVIVNFLENRYVRVYAEADRQQLRPTNEQGDFVQYMNNLTEYLSCEELAAPQLIINLGQKIISASTPAAEATPQQQALFNKEAKTRLVLLTYLVAKAIEFEYSDIIAQEGESDDAEHPILAAPSATTTASTPAPPATQFDPAKTPNFPLELLSSLPLSDELQSNVADFALLAKKKANSPLLFQQQVLKTVQKLLETMSLNKATPLAQAHKLTTWNAIPVQVASHPDVEQAAFNQAVEQNELQQAVAKPIAHWLSMTSANVGDAAQAAQTTLTPGLKSPQPSSTTITLPPANSTKIIVTAKIIMPDEDDANAHSTVITVPPTAATSPTPTPAPSKKAPKGRSPTAAMEKDKALIVITPTSPPIKLPTTLHYQPQTKPIFEITNIDEHNMTLYQYILYNATLYSYMIPITAKLGVYFTFPRELYEFSTQLNTFLSTLQADPNAALNIQDFVSKLDIATLVIQVKAVHIVLSSVLREFARKIQSELTTVLLALKTFETTHDSGIVDPAIVIPLDDAVKYDEKGEVVVNENVPLTMPSHIFVHSSSNLKKGGKADKGGKGGKTTTTAAEHGKMIDTTLVPKTDFDLATIRQSRLNKEQFAVRNANITTFINDRYHFNKLLAISELHSQSALNQLLHLNTLPLGESAIQPQLAMQVDSLTTTSPQPPQKKPVPAAPTAEMSDTLTSAETQLAKGKKGKASGKATTTLAAKQHTPEEAAQLAMLGRPESFLSIFVTLVRMLYDVELQQHQTVITRWVQHLQTFTARAGKATTY